MPSPFPGMDPYLEAHWRDVHASLIVYGRNQLGRQLPAGLKARAEEYLVVEDERSGERIARLSPDVQVRERDSSLSPQQANVATLEDDVRMIQLPVSWDPTTEREIRIIDHHRGDRLVTAIEILSVTNKTHGRDEYRAKQREFIDSGVNLVEIDLLRGGDWIVMAPQQFVPFDWQTPYKISVLQCVPRAANWYYAAGMQERLPSIQIPLRPGDPLVRLDLQPLIDQAYLDGGYADIDYTREPVPPLPPTEARWVDDWLRKQGRR
jgi:Protein of unknown function (DUF4058)